MISVIIPNFNKSKYLSQTIDCLKNQSFELWECIIIDDNSSDESLKLIEKLTYDDKRFKIHKLKINRGANYCRNEGIKNAKHQWIIFLDGDDLLSRNSLKTRIEIAHKYNSLDFLVFPTGTFYDKVGDSSWLWNNFQKNHLNQFLSHDLPWVICSVLWKKKFLIKINYFDESINRLQDVDLHTRALIANDVKYLTFSNSTPDSFYRINNERIFNFLEHVKNDIDGKLKYIIKFKKIAPFKTKYLKGTFIECYYSLFSFYQKKLISQDETNDLVESLNVKIDLVKFSKIQILILKTYVFLRKKNFYIKSMNRTFKFFLVR